MAKPHLARDLILCTITLTLIGLLFIFSASSVPAYQKYKDLFFFPKKQAISVVLGTILSIGMIYVPSRIIGKASLLIFLFTLILCGLTLSPTFGHSVNGASRWLKLYFLSFQPAELAKLASIIFLAKNLSRPNFKGFFHFKSLLSCLIPYVFLITVLMCQPDFGSSLLILLVSFSMIYIAGLPRIHVIISTLLGLTLISFAIWQAPYRMARLTSFLSPWESAQTGGFQIIQSYLGFYNGGLLGLGIGSSQQKLYFLPEAHTDFILSVIGEELGLSGVLIIISIFAYMVYLSFTITARQKDLFQKLMSFGITCLIAMQTAINMGVAMGLLPTKGMPLPFISHGSSSLIVFFLAISLLVRLNLEMDQKDARS